MDTSSLKLQASINSFMSFFKPWCFDLSNWKLSNTHFPLHYIYISKTGTVGSIQKEIYIWLWFCSDLYKEHDQFILFINLLQLQLSTLNFINTIYDILYPYIFLVMTHIFLNPFFLSDIWNRDYLRSYTNNF